MAGRKAVNPETAVSLEFAGDRVEPCACGGFLRADPANARTVRAIVVGHRRTWRHQAWLARLEAEG